MKSLAQAVAELNAALARELQQARQTDAIPGANDDDLLATAATAAAIRRRVDGLLIEITAEIDQRQASREHPDRMTTTHGCRNLSELLQRATRCSPQTAGLHIRIARHIARNIAPSTGEALPAELPELRAALQEGAIDAETMGAVLGPLTDLRHAVGRDVFLRAESELAHAARGTHAPPASWHDLRLLAQVLVAYLDPDGAEPRDGKAMRKRGLSLGAGRDGLIPIRGNLLPDVAGQLQRIFDSLLNPKIGGSPTDGPAFVDSSEWDEEQFARQNDPRSRTQKQHDALATALTVAARAGELPTIGGAAPTLIVSVRAEDYLAHTGTAVVEGIDQPVPMGVARQVACAGNVERVVFGEGGRILTIGVSDRVFAHHQRLAITRRDGGCIIPGCTVPAAWCEIHHVTEHSRGGPTHTDNGVLVCWHHHRTLDSGQWQIRMNAGVPEVKGPSWWDAYRHWHPAGSQWRQRSHRLTG